MVYKSRACFYTIYCVNAVGISFHFRRCLIWNVIILTIPQKKLLQVSAEAHEDQLLEITYLLGTFWLFIGSKSFATRRQHCLNTDFGNFLSCRCCRFREIIFKDYYFISKPLPAMFIR